MSIFYDVLMEPSILEPEDGDEENCHHYVSFSAKFDVYSGGAMHTAQIPPRTLPRLQFFAEGPQIIREFVATSAVSCYITVESTDRMIEVIRNDTLPKISANYRAKMLAVHLEITRYMTLREFCEMLEMRERLRIHKIVYKLPVVDIDGGDEEEEGKDLMCSICLKDLYLSSTIDQDHGDKKIVVRMPCSHVFDRDCLAKWFEKSLTCPMCRYVVPSRTY